MCVLCQMSSFAPAFEKESFDIWHFVWQFRLLEAFVFFLVFLAFSFEKNFEKKLRKNLEDMLKTSYLCTRFWKRSVGVWDSGSGWSSFFGVLPFRKRALKILWKKREKNFRKNLEDILKTPYLCNRFPLETGRRMRLRSLKELHKQYK